MKWEYNLVPLNKTEYISLEELNNLGADGWELVQVINPHIILKRPIYDQINNIN